MKISDNTILITGGTSGIGRGLAEALNKLNNKVIVAGRRKNLLDEISAANPGIYGIELDVSDRKSIDKAVEVVREKYPDLNVLVNNAGIARMEDWSKGDVDTAQAAEIISTNVLAVIELTAAFLPLLKGKPDATIITTTSGLAFIPLASAPTYSASKAFLHSWLQSLRFQLRDSKVEILELAPPYVQTELGGEAQAKDPAAMPLDEYVQEVVDIIKSGDMPDGEILVERVKGFRAAERNGVYDKTFEALNTMMFAHQNQ